MEQKFFVQLKFKFIYLFKVVYLLNKQSVSEVYKNSLLVALNILEFTVYLSLYVRLSYVSQVQCASSES